jgi:drug/metabolite transporter (DMT)-like permease
MAVGTTSRAFEERCPALAGLPLASYSLQHVPTTPRARLPMSIPATQRHGATVAAPVPRVEAPSGTVPAVAPTADNPARGILLVIASLALFACSDATGKLLNSSFSPLEIGWIRYLVYMLYVAPALLRDRRIWRTANPRMQILRGLGMTGSAVIFIFATRSLKLADATAIGFTSPLFITALSIPVLGEKVGLHRWGAILVGLVGVLVIVRPGGHGFAAAALLPVCSSAAWAIAVVVTRRMVGSDSLLTTMAYSAAVGLVVTTLLLPFVFQWPTPYQLALGLLIGVFSTAAQWLIGIAYRLADASLLAPFSYSQLIWATMFGFLVFGALPDEWTVLGAAIIVASGLYTAHRERVVAYRR